MKAHAYHPTELRTGQRILTSDGIGWIIERRWDHDTCGGRPCVCIAVQMGHEILEYRLSVADGEQVWVIQE